MLTGKQHLHPLMLTLASFSQLAFVIALNVIPGACKKGTFLVISCAAWQPSELQFFGFLQWWQPWPQHSFSILFLQNANYADVKGFINLMGRTTETIHQT